MSTQHKFFPLGVKCCHCHRWHDLSDAIEHVSLFHPECESCVNEQQLAEALLEDAGRSLDVVLQRERDVEAYAG